MIRCGFQKEKYAEIYFLKTILSDNDAVIDIGANLGYYSYFMAKKVLPKGKVIAIEPIPLFVEVWRKNLKKYYSDNLIIENTALGDGENEKVKMSIPIVNGVVRHGLTKVNQESDTHQSFLNFDVNIVTGDSILAKNNLSKIDYIKCDVEGYEQFVIPSLGNAIDKFTPTIQIELNGDENRKNVVDFLLKKEYFIFILKNHLLKSINQEEIFNFNQDFYFIHKDKIEIYQNLIQK